MGPASVQPQVLSTLVREGMDVARLNFSHGSHDFHRKTIALIRKLSRTAGRPIAVLQDLQGIKIRVGMVKDGAVELSTGSEISLLPGEGLSDEKNVFVTYPSLVKDAKKGDRILIDDGLIQLRITKKSASYLSARVFEGGILRDRKGVNLPGMKISLKPFTDKDINDLSLGLTLGVDFVAVSFVREAEDIERIRAWMKKKGKVIPIIAKIEKPEALDNIDDILDISDGIMIARGDLGVEVFPERVPIIQKDLINKANNKGRLVITATQMLESMKEHMRPTRAEATDVANAVIDGTDALMLSAETSTGAYPVAAFRMMDRIITVTEQNEAAASCFERGDSYAEALADAACRAAKDVKAKVLVAFTASGFTARLASKFRPVVPIIAFTPERAVLTRLSLSWGVVPKYMKHLRGTDQMLLEVEKALLAEKIAAKGDHIVIIAGSPLSSKAKTNFMKIHQIGE